MTSVYTRANWGPIRANEPTRLAIPVVDAKVRLVSYNKETRMAFIEVNSLHEHATGWIGGKFAEFIASRIEPQMTLSMGILVDPNASGAERVLAVGIGEGGWIIFPSEQEAIVAYRSQATSGS